MPSCSTHKLGLLQLSLQWLTALLLQFLAQPSNLFSGFWPACSSAPSATPLSAYVLPLERLCLTSSLLHVPSAGPTSCSSYSTWYCPSCMWWVFYELLLIKLCHHDLAPWRLLFPLLTSFSMKITWCPAHINACCAKLQGLHTLVLAIQAVYTVHSFMSGAVLIGCNNLGSLHHVQCIVDYPM